MMKLSLMSRVVATLNEEYSSPLALKIASKWFTNIKKVVYLRASSNFIFEVVTEQGSYILRFNSVDERSVELVKAEVEVLNFLNLKGFSVSTPLKSLSNNYFELVTHDMGKFIAIVYKKLEGAMYDYEELHEQQIKLWGAELAKIHTALQAQKELEKRPTWQDLMCFIKSQIASNEVNLLTEYKELNILLSKLPINIKNYGLIHFDFEADNIIFNNNNISSLDFDDMCVLWFAADILYAVRSIFENKEIDLNNPNFNSFIEGYSSIKKIDKEELKSLPLFMRLHRLYNIARLRRSLDITDFSKYPEWVEKLSNRIQQNYIRNSINDICSGVIHVR